MLHHKFLWLFLFCVSFVVAQDIETPYKSKIVVVQQDTITIDNVPINSAFFKIQDRQGNSIDTSNYFVDFSKAKVFFKSKTFAQDTVKIRYLKFPDFLTKTYSIYDKNKVIANESGQLLVFENPNANKFKPFDGLSTSGSITRGVTIGNNQNATVNSNLDLQIVGKISDKVSLRASIQDSNIPLQEGGYSQKLDEFDQIFIELFSDTWKVKAGDLFIENRTSKFLNFNKKVQGISNQFSFGNTENKTEITASAALVRGQYAKSSFVGQEGNQGPYKLKGNNGELYVLVISGSERVFVNGKLLARGENNQYIIDYNAGEIIFTSLFPISSEMRIVIEYQYSDRNYTRFITYLGGTHQSEDWNFGGYLYSESDIKNQPLQQNLSSEQVSVLQQAGDNTALMSAPTAYIDSYSENKILYKKTIISGIERFEFSTNPNDELYQVKFSFVGNNQGNYLLSSSNAIGKIYQYTDPINGIPQGNYSPVRTIIPPTKIQMAIFFGTYKPSDLTDVDFEIAISNNDLNLFSTIDDANNKGAATRFDFKKCINIGASKIDFFANHQFVQQNFRTIERLYSIEFNRDWNLVVPQGNQSLLIAGVRYHLDPNKSLLYQIEKLDFSDYFSGIRHRLEGNLTSKNISVTQKSSFLKSNSNTSSSAFVRNETRFKYQKNNNWIGATTRLEDNQERMLATQQLSPISQRFTEYGLFTGRGDSTKVFTEVGFLRRKNDSIQNGFLQHVATSNTYYLKSKLIQNKTTNLSINLNYRRLNFSNNLLPTESSVNARLFYNDSFFNQIIQSNTTYETMSGSIAQQEFTYLEVNQGQGVYAWNDYNNNGIQELQEFEVAPFPDQAKYVRIFLPNQYFLKTHQNKFSQSITLSPSKWINESGFKKALSHFYNQTSFAIDRKEAKNQSFNFNPFDTSSDDLLGINANFRNSLFYNRGKQNHSVTYNYLKNQVKNLLSIGSQENANSIHQLQYTHLIRKSWLVHSGITQSNVQSLSDNYASRNYKLEIAGIDTKLTYLFSKSTSLSFFYKNQFKRNQNIGQETLNQHHFGAVFNYSNQDHITLNGEFSLYSNQFTGTATSPVAFQMLEGLQPGQNSTWRLLLQKKLTQYLDININYQGRKSYNSSSIHTGNVQLRAFF
jgi:hypothetical protein